MAYLIASRFLRHFGDRVVELGSDPLPLVERLGILAACDAHPEPRWLRAEQVRSFFDLAAVEVNDSDLGLNTALTRPRGAFGAFEFALRCAPDLRTGLQLLADFAPPAEVGLETRLEVDAQEARLSFTSPDEPEGLGRHGHEFRLIWLARTLREVAGADWRPSHAWFANPEPASAVLVARALGTSELAFRQLGSGFAMSGDWLDVPLAHADPALFAYLRQVVREEARLQSAVASTFKEKLRELVHRGSFQAESLARGLHMSRRTLQRRLAEEGTTFHALLDEVRADAARDLLAATATSASEVAQRLGYANHRAFDRAFHRWTGVTPSMWRQSSAARQAAAFGEAQTD